jgi:hypothetical protein
MHTLLHVVHPKFRLVVQYHVVRRLDHALEPRMGLKVKVKIENGRHTLVDDRAQMGVAVPFGMGRVSQEEPCVVPFAADDDAEFR